MLSLLAAAASGSKASPAKPTLSRTGLGQFKITNYDPAATYQVNATGAGSATRSGDTITVTAAGTTATVIAQSPRGSVSSPATCERKARTRTLGAKQQTIGGIRCGWNPWPTTCCSSGWIMDTAGNSCTNTGTYHNNPAACGYQCNDCFTLYADCYSWSWTDYSGSGYTLTDDEWWKVT